MACDWTIGMETVNGCLKASSKREGRVTRLTARAGEGEGSVRFIERCTVGICGGVCAPREKHAFKGSMLRMTASDSVS